MGNPGQAAENVKGEGIQMGHQNPMYQQNLPPQPQGYNPNGVGYGYQQGTPVQAPPMMQASPMMQQPLQGMQMNFANPNQPWSSELFDCMNDPNNALITLFFPCVTFGQIAEIIDSGHTTCGTSGMLYGLICCLIGVPCIYSCTFRTKMRNKFGLAEAPAPDWITHCLCECCALCQVYRELNSRGLDPAIGWLGNVQRNPGLAQQGGGMMMTPPMNQRMM